MSLLLAELGIEVHLYDPSQETVDSLLKKAEDTGLSGKLKQEKDYEALCKSLGSPKVFFFSLSHGSVGERPSRA